MRIEVPRIFAIVPKGDYHLLRALLADLPDEFTIWVQRRLFGRRSFEEVTGRLAAVEQVDIRDYERFCRKSNIAPSQTSLDDWATSIHWMH